MRRVPLFTTLSSAAIAAAVILRPSQFAAGAKDGIPTATKHGFVGPWRLIFDTPLGPSQSLLTVMADGTVVFSGRPVSPASGGNPVTFASAGHGAWQQDGPGAAAITWVGLVTDAQGNFLAVVTDSVEATLDGGGDGWSGTYSATVADPDGNVLYVGDGTVTGTRIRVQPLAKPSGTPAS